MTDRHLPAKPKRFNAASRRNTSAPAKPTVLLVDDDPSVLSGLARLVRASGYQAEVFDRPALLLASRIPRSNACVIADIYLPDMSGVDLCDELSRAGVALPCILITGRNDAATRRLIGKSHALAVLYKPIDEVPLLDAIARAVAVSKC